MLVSKVKIRIFEEAVHEHDKLAHAGYQSDFGFFAVGAKTDVEGFENGVKANSTERRHIECTADGGSSTGDMSSAALIATIAIVGSNADQGRGSLITDASELWQFSQDGSGGDCAHARNSIESSRLALEIFIGCNQLGDGNVAGSNLFIQKSKKLTGLPLGELISVVKGAIAFAGAGVDQLQSASRQFTQAGLCGRRNGARNGFDRPTIVTQNGRINGIGFGAQAFGFGEVANTASFDNADWNLGGVQDPHDGLFVAPGRFANDMRAGMSTQEFEQLSMTFGVVGQAVRLIGQIELQRGLGNVEADVEDGGVVLTHTCVDTSRDGCRAEALKQRFEFRTMGRAERALRRITL